MVKISKVMLAALAVSLSNFSYAQSTGRTPVPAPTPHQVVERGPNHKVWQWETYKITPDGKTNTFVHKLTELASGLNYTNANGQWMDSQELIEPYAQGAIARHGQYQVIFANNLNSAGAIDEQTPDGKRLRSNILGLSYYDSASGQSVVIAQVQDSQGELISSNQVLYPDAFQGVKADVRYTYRKGSFEQDVILREQPPTPESFGLNSATTEIEVMTEFLNPPQATVKKWPKLKNGQEDQDISWGAMRLGQGKTFDLGETSKLGQRIPVSKQYGTVSGRTILLENVPVEDFQADLQTLPLQSSAKTKLPAIVSKTLALPKTPLAEVTKKPIKMAVMTPPDKGYVLDYVEVLNDSVGDYTFNVGTYFISDPVYCGNVTLCGGAVIKYPNATTAYLEVYGTITCQTGPYNPAVFTAGDDDSLGESLNGVWAGYSGYLQSGGYANPAIWDDQEFETLKNIRICYARQAIYVDYPCDMTLADSQIISCSRAVALEPGLETSYVTLKNCLIGDPANWGMPYYDGYDNGGVNTFVANGYCTFTLYNCTVDDCAQLVESGEDGDPIGVASIYSANSIFSDVGSFGDGNLLGGYNGFYDNNGGETTFGDNPISGSGYYPFDQYIDYGDNGMIGGCYYLTDSSFMSQGTSDPSYVQDSTVLPDIQQKTTQPPEILGNITENTTLSPRVSGDNQSSPDLGYHYPRLDYVFPNSEVDANLTINAGTAVGWTQLYSLSPGLALASGKQITFAGNAQNPCYFVRCNTIFEVDAAVDGGGESTGIGSSSSSGGATVNATFSKFYTVGPNVPFFGSMTNAITVSANNCEFWNGKFCEDNTGITLNLFNCLLDEPSLYFQSASGSPASSFTLQNCTLIDYNNILFYTSSWPIHITNCAFDGYLAGTSDTNTFCNYNAYLQGSPHTHIGGTNNITVTNFNWQSSWLGDFYLPSDSSLTNAGSTTADQVGLFYFTTQTNQIFQGFSTLDIGYHYVAVDANGNPFSNQFGASDYLGDPSVNDTSGDGLSDALEVLLGLNPQTSNLTQPGLRANYGYTPADWLSQVSGIKIGSITNDPEGNVLEVSQ